MRRQLTLFVAEDNQVIESIRAKFNPEQFQLIPAHVTLCREDEIEPINKVIENIQSICLAEPLCLEFDKIRRFSGGKGVWIPGKGENVEFHKLRKAILQGVVEPPQKQEAHITLMHPRNATCTDELFQQLIQYSFPSKLHFNKISFIEQQQSGGKWKIL